MNKEDAQLSYDKEWEHLNAGKVLAIKNGDAKLAKKYRQKLSAISVLYQDRFDKEDDEQERIMEC